MIRMLLKLTYHCHMTSVLLHQTLSYNIRGILYKVHNELGQFRNEKQYGDAVAYYCNQQKIFFQREAVMSKSFVGEHEGRNRVDFIIDSKIILELKVVPGFSRRDYDQCLRYLISSGLDLALLVNFRSDWCAIKRILNPALLKNGCS